MTRYPHLPTALHQLLERVGGVWVGTPTELYAALEPYRAEPWPSSAVSLSLWLRNHGEAHNIVAVSHHTGERRLLRLGRVSNGLGTGYGLLDNGQFRNNFENRFDTVSKPFRSVSWPELEAALPRLVHTTELVTLVLELPQGRYARVLEPRYLEQTVREWSARYPDPLTVWLVPGAVSLTEWQPPTSKTGVG